MKQLFSNKSILVIGGTGTIGKALITQLLKFDVKVIRVYSRDEYKQFLLQQEFAGFRNIRYLIGDVRDKERLMRAMQGIDIVFNLAAMKHVPASEYNPFEAVKTNVIGVENTIVAAMENNVKKVVYTSSDKAVSPVNTMGATKLLAERLMSSADFSKGREIPVFTVVRFGNVIGTRGSVIPLWQQQIKESGRITVTEPDMTRFMMSVKEAVGLVMRASKLACGGEVFVLKMPVIRLGDLVQIVIEDECKKLRISIDAVEVSKIGLRPGEKMYEELMTCHESLLAVEYDDMYAILPQHKVEQMDSCGVKRAMFGDYNSQKETAMTRDKIREMLRNS